ncbi:hypothetical protein [Nonlabens sp. Hel1_33_55]|uniref:hypothetical protein n=1 Tax=Nonlabens sp. Hel1_33_55 TaxID=1336802 RepID=UPI0012FD2D92|nr:hypothetical protein [Nonlabens sp. Hel1_33_55]
MIYIIIRRKNIWKSITIKIKCLCSIYNTIIITIKIKVIRNSVKVCILYSYSFSRSWAYFISIIKTIIITINSRW